MARMFDHSENAVMRWSGTRNATVSSRYEAENCTLAARSAVIAAPDMTMSQTAGSRPSSRIARLTGTNSAVTPRSRASCSAISASNPTSSPRTLKNTYGRLSSK